MNGLGETLLNLVLAAAVAYAALGGFAFFAGERVMFQPPPPTYSAGDPDLIRITTADGVGLAAFWLPAPEAELTVLYSHGNAEDLGTVRPALERLRRLGFSVLAYDYRGYGLSDPVAPSEEGAYLDIAAAYRHLTEERGIAPERIVVYGFSVGSGPAVHLAARRPVAGLVLRSPFTTAFRVVTRIPLLPFDRFRNIDRIDDVDCPLLVIHGTDDGIVPFAHGRRLHRAADEPKDRLWVDGAGHNDLGAVAGRAYDRALAAFAERVLRAAPSPR